MKYKKLFYIFLAVFVITEDEFNEIFYQIDDISSQLGGFKKKLKS